MEKDAGPSTSEELSEIEERSFSNENFKGEFTNALLAAESIYKERNLLTNKPPKKISSVSLAMAEQISKATLNVLNECIVIADEELILFDESDDEGNFKECTDDPKLDGDYIPEDYKEFSAEYIPLEYKEKIVALAQAHPKWSLTTLQRCGAHRLKHKAYLQRWKEDIKKGGTRFDKLGKIDSETFERFGEARRCLEQVTTRTLQQWAMTTAFPFLSENFQFEASLTWVKVFKRKHKIKQRKITKFVSKRDIATLEETVQAAEQFQRQTKCLISKFDLDFVINTDQTGCQYQMTYNRSLDFRGVKTVFVKKQSLNKLTHSYTAQYSITASGKLLPLVFLCLQEPTNKFGPTVSKKIKKLTTEFKNVVVTCSKSGKLTKELYKQFLQNILVPYVNKNKFMLIIDSWEGQTDPSLHDKIFENDSGEATCTLKFIPPKCTPLCQPCDVYFYRQVKILIKKLQNAPTLIKNQREIASREDAIKIHSSNGIRDGQAQLAQPTKLAEGVVRDERGTMSENEVEADRNNQAAININNDKEFPLYSVRVDT
ncbi:hypothetical protein ALC62_10866 [Cyphomyrmex costatus]|uniref:DDE-1 domain-containing protein n=1 Tax=Cyphomyrmex costatus TaxID=456900 RepID=A0A151IDI6_9HYME|nr:hypothetical protein ALC62_10866 [Cyphomyrmex costatus]